MLITFSKELYPKIALMKSAYAFTDRAYIHLDADDRYYTVKIYPKEGHDPVTEKEFINEMLCQCVRHEVYQQTKTVRELLIARAMASTVIEQPGVAAQDPIQPEQIWDEKQILTDWFEGYDKSETE